MLISAADVIYSALASCVSFTLNHTLLRKEYKEALKRENMRRDRFKKWFTGM